MYVQIVFAVKYRQAFLDKNIRDRIFSYIGGSINGLGHKSIIINGMADHVHILFGLNPARSISDTVHDIKRGSSLFINENKLCACRFAWQEGYGGFTYSHSQIDTIYNYILNQEERHKRSSFREEYLEFLRQSEIDFDYRFLFEFIK